MRTLPKLRLFALSAVPLALHAAPRDSVPYLDVNLPAEQRAADLVHDMTLQEKVSQLVNQSRAIPRLGVPAYDWWSESLHGVIANGVTVFPEPIGLAATFDPAAIHEMAIAIGVEGRIKHAIATRAGHSKMFEGLDFWAPNVNIFRDPRWGRGQETYGEDPYLSARLAVAYVTGLQGDDPSHYRAISTPKHFAVHSGPEPTRHFADIDVSRHDLEDTYLPAFRAAIVEGKAGSIMCAYNAINGEPACANQFLLEHTLRGAWQFQGYVVSDCDAVRNIFLDHHFRPTQPQASAISLMRGMDNECIDSSERGKDDSDYRPYLEAVQTGYLPETAVDSALVRLFSARMKLGLFDPPSQGPYSKLDPSELEGPAHRALAHRLAAESMVLLKNEGILPLHSVKRIAVVGALAEQTTVLLGNYHGQPSRAANVLEGIRSEFPGAQVSFQRGTQYLSDAGETVPAAQLRTADGKPGLVARYNLHSPHADESAYSRVEPTLDLSTEGLPREARTSDPVVVEWNGYLTPRAAGDYLLGIESNGASRLYLNGQKLIEKYGPGTDIVPVHFADDHLAELKVDYAQGKEPDVRAKLLWMRENNAPDPLAVDAAKEADVIIAVVGLTSRLEGEEMPVERPGFSGGDRTNIDLPKPEQDLLEALAATGKPLVVVLLNGSALGIGWAKTHANAILEAWYPGQDGGKVIAETLSGNINPAGRLPVTFYKDIHQLPSFENYAMSGRTYRYFKGEPLWPFGFGLSYTSFEYRDLKLKSSVLNAGESLDVSATVRNARSISGDEVAQVYLQFPPAPGAPLRALRAFQRLHLEPNGSRRIEFHLDSRALSSVTEAGDIVVAPGTYSVSVGGGQPGTGAPSITTKFAINGQIFLPE